MLKVVADIQEWEGAIGPQTLDEVALQGARRMLRDALELEVAAYLERHREAREELQGVKRLAPGGGAIRLVRVRGDPS